MWVTAPREQPVETGQGGYVTGSPRSERSGNSEHSKKEHLFSCARKNDSRRLGGFCRGSCF